MICDRRAWGILLACLQACGWFGVGTNRPHNAGLGSAESDGSDGGTASSSAAFSSGDMVEFGPAIIAGRMVLDPFGLDRTEVTAAQYRSCLQAGACEKPVDDPRAYTIDAPGADNHPVNGVSRDQAAAYCKWAGKRLPTGEEWVWAARGRDEARPFPWGSEDPTCDRLHLVQLADAERIGCAPDGRAPGIAAVGSHPAGASRDGLLDMAGNLGEWTSSDRSPEVALLGTWGASVGLTWEDQSRRSYLIGFRCAAARQAADVPGVLGKDGVLVADVAIESGDPWPSREDSHYGCYFNNPVQATRIRRRRDAKTTVVPVYDWDGATWPPDKKQSGTMGIAAGALVSVKSQVTLSIAESGYYVSQSGSCLDLDGLGNGKNTTVALREGSVVYVRYSPESNSWCETAGEEWPCDGGWLDPDPDDAATVAAAKACFRNSLTPVKLRAPTGTRLGWWIKLDDGWVHADGEFVLEVQCDDCEIRVTECISQLRCETEACKAKCEKLHAKCDPSTGVWGEYPPPSDAAQQ